MCWWCGLPVGTCTRATRILLKSGHELAVHIKFWGRPGHMPGVLRLLSRPFLQTYLRPACTTFLSCCTSLKHSPDSIVIENLGAHDSCMLQRQARGTNTQHTRVPPPPQQRIPFCSTALAFSHCPPVNVTWSYSRKAQLHAIPA